MQAFILVLCVSALEADCECRPDQYCARGTGGRPAVCKCQPPLVEYGGACLLNQWGRPTWPLLAAVTAVSVGLIGVMYVLDPEGNCKSTRLRRAKRYTTLFLALVWMAWVVVGCLHLSTEPEPYKLLGAMVGCPMFVAAVLNNIASARDRQRSLRDSAGNLENASEIQRRSAMKALRKQMREDGLRKNAVARPVHFFHRRSAAFDSARAGDELEGYIKNFDAEKKPGFFLVTGVKAAGKSTLLEKLLSDPSFAPICLPQHQLLFDDVLQPLRRSLKVDDSVPDAAVLESLSELRAELSNGEGCCASDSPKSDGSGASPRRKQTAKVDISGKHLVLYINLGDKHKRDHDYAEARRLGETIGEFCRTQTYDQPRFPIVVESSIAAVTDSLQKHGDICRVVHVPALFFSEFESACELKFAAGGGPYAALAPAAGAAGAENLLEAWYFKIGSNARELGATLEGLRTAAASVDEDEKRKRVRDGFSEAVGLKYEVRVEQLYKGRFELPDDAVYGPEGIALTRDDALEFLTKVAKAGPPGVIAHGAKEVALRRILLERRPSDALLHVKGDAVAMWRLSYVHWLLQREAVQNCCTPDRVEQETRSSMKRHGWYQGDP